MRFYPFSAAIGLTIGALFYRPFGEVSWDFTAGLIIGAWMPVTVALVTHVLGRRFA